MGSTARIFAKYLYEYSALMRKYLHTCIIILMSFLVSIQGFGVYSFNRVVLAPSQNIILDLNQDEQKDLNEQDDSDSDSDSIPLPLTLPDEETKEDCVDIDDLKVNQSLIHKNLYYPELDIQDFHFLLIKRPFSKAKTPTPPPDVVLSV